MILRPITPPPHLPANRQDLGGKSDTNWKKNRSVLKTTSLFAEATVTNNYAHSQRLFITSTRLQSVQIKITDVNTTLLTRNDIHASIRAYPSITF